MEGRAGIEPATARITTWGSATELPSRWTWQGLNLRPPRYQLGAHTCRAPCPFAAVQLYPQRESNPRRRRERAVSWATRRWGPVGTLERPRLPRQVSNLGLPNQSRASCRWTTGHQAHEGLALRNEMRQRVRGVGRNKGADGGELLQVFLRVKFMAGHVGSSSLRCCSVDWYSQRGSNPRYLTENQAS